MGATPLHGILLYLYCYKQRNPTIVLGTRRFLPLMPTVAPAVVAAIAIKKQITLCKFFLHPYSTSRSLPNRQYHCVIAAGKLGGATRPLICKARKLVYLTHQPRHVKVLRAFLRTLPTSCTGRRFLRIGECGVSIIKRDAVPHQEGVAVY